MCRAHCERLANGSDFSRYLNARIVGLITANARHEGNASIQFWSFQGSERCRQSQKKRTMHPATSRAIAHSRSKLSHVCRSSRKPTFS
jgi:hypothetical protein